MPSYSSSFACKKLPALFGKVSPWNRFHMSPKENLASTPRSKTFVLYTNKTSNSFVNSSVYGWFTYWAFKYPLWIFDYMIKLIIISHPNLSLKHACGNHLFYFMIFITWRGLQKWFSDYFHSLTLSGCTSVSSETCINSSHTKALSGLSCK